MIVDKEGNLFENRRKNKDRRKVDSNVETDGKKNRRKEDRRKENNKIRKS